MRKAALLLTLTLSGCWPYISGSWEDYYLPEDVQIVGTLRYYEYQGSYWDGDTTRGSVWWGWLDEPTTSVSGFDLVAASQGCTVTPVGTDGVLSLMGNPGADASFLAASNGQSVELTWLSAEKVFFGEFTDSAWATADVWDLAPVETGEQGKFGVQDFILLPPELEIETTMDFGGSTWPVGSIGDLGFTWDDVGDSEDQWFLVQAESVNAAGNTLEVATCITELGRGELSVNADVFTTTPAAWYVSYGPVSITHARVGSLDVASSISAAHVRVGYLERG